MTNLSALIGKPILNLLTSRIEGNVYDVYFDAYLKKAVYFCISQNDVDSPSKTMLLPFEEAQNIADAVVIADSVKFISPLDVDVTSLLNNVLGREAYLPTGVSKGKLTDVFINNANKVSKCRTETDEFVPSAIISIGDVLILKSTTKIKQRKVTMPRPEEDRTVYILNDTEKVLSIEKAMRATNTPQVTAVAPISITPDVKTSLQEEITSVQPNVSNIQLSQATAVTPAPAVSAVITPATQEPIRAAQPKAIRNEPISQITTVTPTAAAAVTIAPATQVAVTSAVSENAKPISLGKHSSEPVLSSGAFNVLLDGSQAYSYEDDGRTLTRVICDYNFLLGRILAYDLCTYTGELIAKQGSVVTDEIVDKARRAGKLVELTLSSVKQSK